VPRDPRQSRRSALCVLRALPSKQSECFNNGTYCVPEPDNDPEKGYSGRDVLLVSAAALKWAHVILFCRIVN
jgi:hypothetical protein